jgi:beta-N-acetylhexosaminidase
VALNAFLAGNDLLILGDFVSNEDPDSYTTIIRTLDFFAQKYRDDVAFAQRVDEAVLRILTLKFRLYENFTLDNVLTEQAGILDIGDSTEVTFEVARQAVTLFSPDPAVLASVLPSPPLLQERMVIITDTYPVLQCSTCPEEEVIVEDIFKQMAIRLYGPETGGQIVRQNLSSYSFADLEIALSVESDFSSLLLSEIRRAEWLVFIMLDVNEDRPASQALQRFLSERPDLIQEKKSIVFAVEAPYYLDATDISKLTAYYGLYSKQPQFIEIAVRLLFKELTAPGASPVSVPGIGYNLTEALSPDPSQIFGLSIQLSGQESPPGTETPEDEPLPDFQQGDAIIIETGIISDYNGNPVPDTTPVQFSITLTATDGNTTQREANAFTTNGIARTSYNLDAPGTLEILASSGDPPALSETIQIVAAETEESGIIVVITQTPPASATDSASAIPTPFPGEEPSSISTDKTTLGDWLLTLLVTGFISLFAYQAGAVAGEIRWGVRRSLTTLIGGLAVNLYLSFDLPGSSALILNFQIWGIVISTAIGAILGWAAGLLWQRMGK